MERSFALGYYELEESQRGCAMCRGKMYVLEDDDDGGRVRVPCDCTYDEVTLDEDDDEE